MLDTLALRSKSVSSRRMMSLSFGESSRYVWRGTKTVLHRCLTHRHIPQGRPRSATGSARRWFPHTALSGSRRQLSPPVRETGPANGILAEDADSNPLYADDATLGQVGGAHACSRCRQAEKSVLMAAEARWSILRPSLCLRSSVASVPPRVTP